MAEGSATATRRTETWFRKRRKALADAMAKIHALILVGLVGFGCVRASAPKPPPSEQGASERRALEEAARHLEAGVRVIDTDQPAHTAKRYAEEGLSILRRHGLSSSISEARLYDLLGRAEHELGAFEAARTAFTEELEILQATGSKRSEVAHAMTRLGATYIPPKDYVSAERVLLEAKKMHEAAERDPLAYADTLQALATLYVVTERTALARQTAQFGLKLPTPGSEQDDRRIWALEMVLAETYRYERNLEASVPHFVAASAAASRHESAFAVKSFDTLERLSKTYYELNQREQAVQMRESSLASWKRNRSTAAPSIAPIRELSAWYRELGRPGDAHGVFVRFAVVVRSRAAGDEVARDGEPWLANAPSIPKTTKEPARTAQTAAPPGNVSNAAKVVAGLRSGFQACYQRTLDRHPNAQGSVSLSMRLAADGSVAASVGYSLELPAETIDCLLEHTMGAAFDRPDGGAAVVNVPVNLVKQ